jgi:2-methylcitrate dehydratase
MTLLDSGKRFRGDPSRPLIWQRTVQKFHWLAEQYADDNLRSAIVHTVETLVD